MTLAFFLGLQGVTLKLIGAGGSVRFNDEVLRGLAIKNVPVTAGWIAAIVAGRRLRRAAACWRYRSRVAKGLVSKPPPCVVAARSPSSASSSSASPPCSARTAAVNPNLPDQRHPVGAAGRVVLLIFWTFMLDRTRFGRHLYAVGGNAEAARRAGINVTGSRSRRS